MKKLIKRYKYALLMMILNVILLLFLPTMGRNSMKLTVNNTKEMLLVIPPIFVLLGLLDVWVKRETMIKLMGEKSGIFGMLIAFTMGSAAAGPLYAAFPIAGILLKKGSKLSNVLIFIGAWSTTKIPLLLFETSAMGWRFMATRFIVNIVGIVTIAYLIEKALSIKDKEELHQRVSEMSQ